MTSKTTRSVFSVLRARPLLGMLAAGALGIACRSAPGDPSSHWNIDSVDNRLVKHFTGYRGEIDGTYVRYQAQQKRDIHKTLRRHFLHNNPDNPFQVRNPGGTGIDPPYGLFPNPLGWFGAEAIFVGGVTMMWTGAFLPLPVGSLLALTTEAGRGEFVDSLTTDFVDTSNSGWNPPPPSTFKVKNR